MSDLGKVVIYLMGKQKRYPLPLKNLSEYLSCIGYYNGRNHLKIKEGLESGKIVLRWQNDRCAVFPAKNISESMQGMGQSEWYLDWIENPKQF